MAWVRIDDQAPRNTKLLKAGPSACWLWTCGLCHCQAQLTDGFISDEALPMIGVAGEGRAVKLAGVLVSVGLWHRDDELGGYRVNDYLAYNSTREEAVEKRDKKRADKSRAGKAGAAARWQRDSSLPSSGNGRPIAEPNGTTIAPSHPIPSVHASEEQKRVARDGTHRGHAFCGVRLHVPTFLHEEFTDQLGEKGLERFDLLTWYPRLDAESDGPIVGDQIKWIRQRFSEESKRLLGPDVPRALASCPHTPACPDGTPALECSHRDVFKFERWCEMYPALAERMKAAR